MAEPLSSQSSHTAPPVSRPTDGTAVSAPPTCEPGKTGDVYATLPTQTGDSTQCTPLADPLFPSIPGFVLVKELGRGGMGVVYLGRHTALGRDVAIKMILSGEQASSSD